MYQERRGWHHNEVRAYPESFRRQFVAWSYQTATRTPIPVVFYVIRYE